MQYNRIYVGGFLVKKYARDCFRNNKKKNEKIEKADRYNLN